jgi:hypothetical protein
MALFGPALTTGRQKLRRLRACPIPGTWRRDPRTARPVEAGSAPPWSAGHVHPRWRRRFRLPAGRRVRFGRPASCSHDSALRGGSASSGASFDKLRTRFDKLRTRFDKLRTRFDKLRTRFDKLRTRFDKLRTSLEAASRRLGCGRRLVFVLNPRALALPPRLRRACAPARPAGRVLRSWRRCPSPFRLRGRRAPRRSRRE